MANKKETEPQAPVESAEAQAPKSFGSTDFEAARMDTKRQLDAQPKKQIRLRAATKDEQNYETVCINGHVYQIKRGMDVPVPTTVYDILDEAGLI